MEWQITKKSKFINELGDFLKKSGSSDLPLYLVKGWL